MEGGIDSETGEPKLLERVDGISYCMDQLIGYSTQVLLGLFMMGGDPLSRALSSKQSSTDEQDYKRAIAFESFKQDKKFAGQDHNALADNFMAVD